MEMTLRLEKMKTSFAPNLTYSVGEGKEEFVFTDFIGKNISLKFSGKIFCQNCGKKTKKSYSQGHCYPCTLKLASCDLCIMKPETCHFEQGTCREPDWALSHCFTPHIIYLANSSGLKVGITRETQVPTRWVDQGATQALAILRVKNRKDSGLVEMIIKKHANDRTDWRKMLKAKSEDLALVSIAQQILQQCADELQGMEIERLNEKVWTIDYPINAYPQKVKSLNLDKTPQFSGTLTGIKGQYLIFNDTVINIRSHSGYEVSISQES